MDTACRRRAPEIFEEVEIAGHTGQWVRLAPHRKHLLQVRLRATVRTVILAVLEHLAAFMEVMHH